MNYRCKYRLSDKVVLDVGTIVPAGHLDYANHGTTIEFNGDTVPSPYEKIYDDTASAEKLDPNPDYKATFELTTTETDTDGDGIPDIQSDGVDTAAITIQKKDENGADMVSTADNDQFFAETSAGRLSVASGNLVNGTATITLQGSTNTGCVVSITARSARDSVQGGSIRIKYI